MASYRLYSKTRTWFGDRGQLLPGGYLKFYEAGSLTRKDVYGDRGLTTNNGDTVALDSSGRLEHDCWADAAEAFFVEVYDADDVKQAEEDNVELPGGTGQVIPIPEEGEFLTGDGAQLLVAEIRQVPDPTGHANEQLGTDGTVTYWEAKSALPDIPEPDQEVGTTTVRIGNFLIQTGTGTAPATGQKGTTDNITFGTAYTSLLHVDITSTISAATGSGALVDNSVTGWAVGSASTGVTVNFNVSDDDDRTTWKITSAVNYSWIAFGLIAP